MKLPDCTCSGPMLLLTAAKVAEATYTRMAERNGCALGACKADILAAAIVWNVHEIGSKAEFVAFVENMLSELEITAVDGGMASPVSGRMH